jgi:hypothetical protein
MSELLTLAGAALLFTVLAMWATAPPYTCAMVPEPRRPLYLDGDVDREHLQRDILAISRMARRYVSNLPADTLSDAPAVDRAVKKCEGELARSLMATHDLTIDQIH